MQPAAGADCANAAAPWTLKRTEAAQSLGGDGGREVTDYIDVDHLLLLEKIRKQRIGRLRKQAEELGLQIVEKQAAA